MHILQAEVRSMSFSLTHIGLIVFFISCVIFVIKIIWRRPNLALGDIVELVLYSSVSAFTAQLFIGSLHFALLGTVYPGESSESLRLIVATGGVAVFLFTLYAYVKKLKSF